MGLSAFVAVIWHLLLKNFIAACVGVVVTTVPVIWFFGSTHFGTFGNPLFIENALGVAAIALIVSIIVGLLIKKYRDGTENDGAF